MSTSDVVTMIHPDLPDQPVTATRRQFEAVWQDRGWKDADAPEADGTPDDKGEPSTGGAAPTDGGEAPAEGVSQPVPPTGRARK